ncbi:hypothetical protein HPP92_026777 [Vanilla planifolia]|uniref:Uncharacterized protein n=1 Tax=Vanilla planifolia TaxID=51239 RepID=A0A835U5E5_VANPL|nr:hypothetical protein HPP92_026967 [Vanilla planifolia]KAG0450366.1 hypothetical protein HPP92_026777 [Vanilla planifolia]
MERKKSLAEELFPTREPAQAKYDILSSIFPPHQMVDGKCSSHSEWKYSSQDAKTNNSSGKNHSSDKWNGNPIYLCVLPESCLMSSSVNYGGRDDDYIPDSSSTNTGMAYNPKKKEEDESDNSDVAIRGDWWLGSYYY